MGLVFFNRFLPDKRKFISVGFDFCSIYEDRFLIDELFFYKLAAELYKALTNEFLHIGMRAEAINCTVTRCVSLRQPHHANAIFQKGFYFTA
ncbi:hypothetical protein D3C81_1263230 [compost metagenome]